jgi:hypothetical protein
MENFGSDVHLRFYDPGNYDAEAQYFQEWSGGAVTFSFSQYFGVGGEVWEAYVGYGMGLARGSVNFEWIVREGQSDEFPEWDAWYNDGGVETHYRVEQIVQGKMTSAWGFEQQMFAELNRRLAGSLYFCAGASFHWVWLEEYKGAYSVTYSYNGETLIDDSGEGMLLILRDDVGIQPVVVPIDEVDKEKDYRPLTVDFVGPRLSFSFRFFF